MKKLWNRIAMTAALLAVTAVVLSLPVGPGKPLAANAVGACPVSFQIAGSTTVGPITVASIAPFQTAWPSLTTANHAETGSGNGLSDLNSDQAGAIAALDGFHADIATMSRKPVVSPGGASREPLGFDEAHNNYFWQIANDGFVIGVNNSVAMSFLTPNNVPDDQHGTNGITVGQLVSIYNAQANIVNLHWSDLNGAWPVQLIIPRMRITGSGSRPDFDKSIGVSDANEALTYAALGGDGGAYPRLTESADMAAAVDGVGDNQIVYTSIAQVATHPNMRVVAVSKTGAANTYVVPSDASIAALTYPLPRQLYIGTHDKANASRVDNSTQVRADDWVNYIRSAAGDVLINAEGFPTIPAASVPPIPDWDIDLNGTVSLGDLGQIIGRWGATSSCVGWIRPDANNDGKVSLGDIGNVIAHWGQDGLICDAAHDCFHGTVNQGPQ